MRNRTIIAVVIVLLIVGAESGFLTHKTWVYIRNDLPGFDLTVHCKSKNDDLGVQVLASQQYFRFHFYPNLGGSTLFFCSFQWTNAFHWFDVYSEGRDYERCFNCIWSVRPDGPCLYNRNTGQYDLCSPWNPPPSSN
ncbi:hypothetical protein CRG98_014768 [Punica granatum]|nr:hypothetical protein CRG98_014768 [Punica granatum]